MQLDIGRERAVPAQQDKQVIVENSNWLPKLVILADVFKPKCEPSVLNCFETGWCADADFTGAAWYGWREKLTLVLLLKQGYIHRCLWMSQAHTVHSFPLYSSLSISYYLTPTPRAHAALSWSAALLPRMGRCPALQGVKLSCWCGQCELTASVSVVCYAGRLKLQ